MSSALSTHVQYLHIPNRSCLSYPSFGLWVLVLVNFPPPLLHLRPFCPLFFTFWLVIADIRHMWSVVWLPHITYQNWPLFGCVSNSTTADLALVSSILPSSISSFGLSSSHNLFTVLGIRFVIYISEHIRDIGSKPVKELILEVIFTLLLCHSMRMLLFNHF